MRVLLWMVSGEEIPGGHRVQIEQTCRHLRQIGIEASLGFSERIEPREFDLVHGLGLSADQIRRCRLAGLPVVLSTLYGGLGFITGNHIDMSPIPRIRHRLRAGAALMRSAICGQHLQKCAAMVEAVSRHRLVYEMADALLPNSQAEADAIRSELGVTTLCYVVPNGVDPEAFGGGAGQNLREGVLYVGRFEPHKNQLGLIRAMRGSSVGLTLVGPPHPHHGSYYARCRAVAGPNVTILPGVEQDELPKIYRRFKVHVLPSWFETTGLVSLEAALCGCNLVTTGRGYAREYFGNMAWYCDPAEPRSIRSAVEAAYAAPYNEDLASHILANFTWDRTAAATAEVYRAVLETFHRSDGRAVTLSQLEA